MTQIKERAVEMIQRMPDDNMFYVINILENLEAMSTDSRQKKERAMTALQKILNFEKRLPEDFDADRELMEARTKNMVVLVDTNVIVDVLMKREPFAKDAQEILTKCATGEIKGYLAAHSIPNLFYILRKEYSQKERREFIRSLCEIFRVSDLNVKKILSAAENEEFSDFEDCLQEECAAAEYADYIITRNPRDFVTSRVKAIAPADFLSLTK